MQRGQRNQQKQPYSNIGHQTDIRKKVLWYHKEQSQCHKPQRSAKHIINHSKVKVQIQVEIQIQIQVQLQIQIQVQIQVHLQVQTQVQGRTGENTKESTKSPRLVMAWLEDDCDLQMPKIQWKQGERASSVGVTAINKCEITDVAIELVVPCIVVLICNMMSVTIVPCY